MSDHFGTLCIKRLRHAVITLSSVITSNSIYAQKQPPEVFYKKGVLGNFTKFTGKHLCQGLFFNKVVKVLS